MTTATESRRSEVGSPDSTDALYERFYLGDITYRQLMDRLGGGTPQPFLSRIIRYVLIALTAPRTTR